MLQDSYFSNLGDLAQQSLNHARMNSTAIAQRLQNQLMMLGGYYKGLLPEAFRSNGFLDPATRQALSMAGQLAKGPGAYPDLNELIAQSKQVEGAFFEPQQGVMEAYQNKFGAGAVPGASGGIRPTSPSFAAPKNLAIAEGRTGSMHNVFQQLLNTRLQYAEMQKQNGLANLQQALANAGAAAGHRANIQGQFLTGMQNLGNTVMQGTANAFHPQDVPLVYGAGGGEGGPGVNGHVSSYYQNQVGPEASTFYRNKMKQGTDPNAQQQSNNLSGSNYEERK